MSCCIDPAFTQRSAVLLITGLCCKVLPSSRLCIFSISRYLPNLMNGKYLASPLTYDQIEPKMAEVTEGLSNLDQATNQSGSGKTSRGGKRSWFTASTGFLKSSDGTTGGSGNRARETTWFCCQCREGPYNLAVDTHCSSCHKRRCTNCMTERRR